MNKERSIEAPHKGGGITVGAWLLLVAGLVVCFGPNFSEMWVRWFPAWKHSGISLYEGITRGESYYTHAPLVPLVSIVIILCMIRYTSVPVKPRFRSGLLVLVSAALFHLAACFARVNFASGFAFIAVLIGLVLLLWGAPALRRLWFPLLFLFFMVPLPEVSIAQLNFRLKMIAADWGVELANLIGIIAERTGNQVFLEDDKKLVVANVCNGLRTLISVIAFGALYAFICQLRGFWRFGLFLMSIPVAVVSNSFRILSLIFVADVWSVEIATGWYHDVSGLMILAMAFALMFSLEKFMLWTRKKIGKTDESKPLFHAVRRTSEEENQAGRLMGAIRSGNGAAAIIVLGLTAAGSICLNPSQPSIYDKNMLQDILPPQISRNQELWYGYNIEVDPRTALILETEDIIQYRYENARGTFVDFCVIFSEDNRKGTHPPDLCLEGGGLDIIAKNSIPVTGIPGQDAMPCRELIVQSGLDYTYYLYTYKCGKYYTDSFWFQQFSIFANGILNRNTDGALIRVSTPMQNGLKDPQARDRAMDFLRNGIPLLERALP
jgi:EpsI family protein